MLDKNNLGICCISQTLIDIVYTDRFSLFKMLTYTQHSIVQKA